MNISGSLTYSGNQPSLTVNGPGTMTVSGTNNTYTNGATINGGVLSVGTLNDTANSNLGSGNLTLGGGTLEYTGVGTSDVTNRMMTIKGNTAIQVDNAAANCTFTGQFKGDGSSGVLTKTGPGHGDHRGNEQRQHHRQRPLLQRGAGNARPGGEQRLEVRLLLRQQRQPRRDAETGRKPHPGQRRGDEHERDLRPQRQLDHGRRLRLYVDGDGRGCQQQRQHPRDGYP